MPVPTLVERYFELASQPDSEDYFALFAEDALVEDERHTHRGLDAIRKWRAEVPLVSYAVTGVDETPEGLVVTATVTGDFPGSPFAGLKYRFEDFGDDRIRVLRIVT